MDNTTKEVISSKTNLAEGISWKDNSPIITKLLQKEKYYCPRFKRINKE